MLRRPERMRIASGSEGKRAEKKRNVKGQKKKTVEILTYAHAPN